jgi:hypothetical protein
MLCDKVTENLVSKMQRMFLRFAMIGCSAVNNVRYRVVIWPVVKILHYHCYHRHHQNCHQNNRQTHSTSGYLRLFQLRPLNPDSRQQTPVRYVIIQPPNRRSDIKRRTTVPDSGTSHRLSRCPTVRSASNRWPPILQVL